MSGEKYSYFIICRNRTVFSHPNVFNISEFSLVYGIIFMVVGRATYRQTRREILGSTESLATCLGYRAP